MKRNTFKTKNQLYAYRYFIIMLGMAVLLLVYLFISNLGTAVTRFKLTQPSFAELNFDAFLKLGASERRETVAEKHTATVKGASAPTVCLYDPIHDNSVIVTQMELTKQPYEPVSSIADVKTDTKLLIIHANTVTPEDTEALRNLSEHDVSLLFIGLPDEESLTNPKLLDLMGIKSVIGAAVWKGLRTSSDLLTGTRVEKTRYEISGIEVTLTDTNKIYASALPEKYWNMKNEDLPPIIWRHVVEGTVGKVYVFNGDYAKTEMGYGILPVVLSEINDSYIYPVINACTIVVSGYPFTENETRESWTRLYSRDKFQIQQDMIAGQLKRYATVYDIKLTCFSPDYDKYATLTDNDLLYFRDEIISARGILAKKSGSELLLADSTDAVEIVDWDSQFSFWNGDTGTLSLPICFTSTVEDERAEEYTMAGFAVTWGYFSANIDYDKFLDYDDEDDVWALYCSQQEVMFGILQRDYGWMECVTMKEAFARTLQVYQMDLDVEYFSDSIRLSVGNFNEKAWFILRSNKKDLTVDHGTLEKIGDDCYFVTMTEKQATVTWEE